MPGAFEYGDEVRAEFGAAGAELPRPRHAVEGLYGEAAARERLKRDPWAHRSAGMRCASCMWFAEKVAAVGGPAYEIGRCRRHAPTMQGYPVVYRADWCGDHKLDETKEL